MENGIGNWQQAAAMEMGDGRLSSVDDHACYTTLKKKIKKLMYGEITMILPNWKADACRPI